MKISCNLIRDILPLYVEDMASQDTRDLVEEHIASCEDCKKRLEEMRTFEEPPVDTDIAPLRNIQNTLRKKKLQTIILSVMATLVFAVVTIAYLTTPAYISYNENAVSIIEKDDGTVLLNFSEEVSGYNVNRYPAADNSGYVYDITTWETIWQQKIYKNNLDNTVLNPNGETVASIYYYNTDGMENTLIYGDPITDGSVMTLPRLVLSYYVLFAIGFLLICGIGLVIFRKNEKVRNGLEKMILLPISYLFAHLLIKGLHSATYLAGRDLYVILLVTIPLYFALLAGRNILKNISIKKPKSAL
ncbi:zf-HC2 domain-containing protein [Mesobacillus selenatarsenatis]|uniref:Anti-sigma-W factor RsiW n=1 Tax=Mesobacillus selenatarsenatis TaxID=388741 RepID=A0A846TJR4_9BACI|nr:zf-HC2 domain-containing protein [Mesobacillus selenatarsenatis]NKE05782.1 zf-HC2 domain-containing protein [Mesobacillus selenatarsenatis]